MLEKKMKAAIGELKKNKDRKGLRGLPPRKKLKLQNATYPFFKGDQFSGRLFCKLEPLPRQFEY